ncbi:alpha/beta hydrolase family protein [Mameliella alba]|uniref:alpha/beta hydrolase family protein n=1 Tax=Mameliella alba TaxID=561184 RepID=UPI0014308027|nr:dienelactone hydrolase-related enzyme [Mameliella alba]
MYYSWLDRWDERRTRRRDHDKVVTEFEFDTDLAFPSSRHTDDAEEFYRLAEQAVTDASSFFGLDDALPKTCRNDRWLSFPSSVISETIENNTVRAKLTTARASKHALVVFHHWNATSRNPQLASFFAWRGFAVFEIALPYHLERARPGSSHADYMLSANLGRTVRSLRQAVVDGRQLIRILRTDGYERVSVLGLSLGSWVAGLIAAHEPRVTRASLFLAGGSLADMVWTGSATRHVRASLEGRIDLAQLRQAWAPLSLESYPERLARPGLQLQMVLAGRDRVVMPNLSKRLIDRIERSGANPMVKGVNCGHYSLALPPYIAIAGMSASRFLNA